MKKMIIAVLSIVMLFGVIGQASAASSCKNKRVDIPKYYYTVVKGTKEKTEIVYVSKMDVYTIDRNFRSYSAKYETLATKWDNRYTTEHYDGWIYAKAFGTEELIYAVYMSSDDLTAEFNSRGIY